MSNAFLYSYIELKNFSVDVLKGYGVPEHNAEVIADSLLDANLRGVDTHGIMRLPVYLERIKKGNLDSNARVLVEKETDFSALLDGGGGFGQVASFQAMALAVNKAGEKGMGVVAVRNSNHFGAAAYYSMMAATTNLIGIALSNAAPRLAPWGGRKPVLGNNPWSIAIPAGGDNPIVVDMANSAAAMGKIRVAAQSNQKIPFGWALSEDGKPTDDPLKALNGILLPMAGHKGYSITLIVDILAGVLTGASFGTKVKPSDTINGFQDVGHLFIAIDIESFMPFETFISRLNVLLDEIRNSDLAHGVDKIYLPGEIEYICKQKRIREGIPLNQPVVEKLKLLAHEAGINF